MLNFIATLKGKFDDFKSKYPLALTCIKYLVYSSSLLLFRKVSLDIYYWLRSTPPGPHGSALPVFGDFISFGKSPVLWLINTPDYYKKYGLCNQLMFVSMGLKNKIFINNIQLARHLTKSKNVNNTNNDH